MIGKDATPDLKQAFTCTLEPPQTKRATKFLYDVFEYVDERVVLVITHSGFTRSVLLAVGEWMDGDM